MCGRNGFVWDLDVNLEWAWWVLAARRQWLNSTDTLGKLSRRCYIVVMVFLPACLFLLLIFHKVVFVCVCVRPSLCCLFLSLTDHLSFSLFQLAALAGACDRHGCPKPGTVPQRAGPPSISCLPLGWCLCSSLMLECKALFTSCDLVPLGLSILLEHEGWRFRLRGNGNVSCFWTVARVGCIGRDLWFIFAWHPKAAWLFWLVSLRSIQALPRKETTLYYNI